jgi:hypothetical protein
MIAGAHGFIDIFSPQKTPETRLRFRVGDLWMGHDEKKEV